MWQAIKDFISSAVRLLGEGQPWMLFALVIFALASLLFIVWQLRRAKVTAQSSETELESNTKIALLVRLKQWFNFILVEIKFLLLPRKQNYRDPWYLIVGASTPSGQQSLLTEVENEHKPYLSRREKSFKAPGSQWHFFKRGVFIAIEDKLFGENGGVEEKTSWNNLLDQIHYYRPERPVDGILLCLQAEALTSNAHEYATQLSNVRRALWQLQEQYDFALPVYVLINQCESVGGFSAFCRAIPESQRQQIFGWSNDARVDQALDLSQMYQQFCQINTVLSEQVLGLAAADSPAVDSDTDSLMMFPYEFTQLQRQLFEQLGKIFKESDPNNAFFIRGIYFTGKEKVNSSTYFVKELLHDKIFAEDRLAYPTNSGTRSHNSRLLRFRAAFVVVACIVATCFGFEFVSVREQVSTISTAHSNMIHEVNTNTTNKVYPIIRSMADMNARHLGRLSMPLSYINTIDEDVSRYLSDKMFIEIIFPALEQKIIALGTQLQSVPVSADQDDTLLPGQGFLQWVQQTQELSLAIGTFETLSIEQHDDDNIDVLERFSELTQYLYKETLPSQFTNNSQLYKAALEQVCYPKSNGKCATVNPALRSFKEQVYGELNLRLLEFAKVAKTEIISDSQYNGKLFTLIKQINLSTTASPAKSISDELLQFSRWIERKRQNWLIDSSNSPCQTTALFLRSFQDAISSEDKQLLPNLEPAIAQFSELQCFKPALQELISHHYEVVGTLFENNGQPTSILKPYIAGLLEGIPHLQSLAFFHPNNEVLPQYISENFYWDPGALADALTFYSDYERFVVQQKPTRTESIETINNIAKNLLFQAMYGAFVAAQLPEKQARNRLVGFATRVSAVPIEQQILEQKVTFFRKSQQYLIQLPGLFNQLGFANAASEVAAKARKYSIGLLQDVDQMAKSNRLYAVNDTLLWMQPNMVSALFGISQPQILKGYLYSQREASNNLVLNYATPALQFILNSDYPFKLPMNAKDEELFSRWYETSVEATKYQTNNPNNSIQHLEDFFNNQLFQMTQSNCFSQVSTLDKPNNVDLFARAQGRIIDAVTSYCEKFNKDIIKREYAVVAQQFNQHLQGRYPFVAELDQNLPVSKEADLAQVQHFFERYSTQNQGLTQRMSLVARKQSSYSKAYHFLQQLDEVALLFAPNLTQAKDFKQTAIGTQVQFRVQVDASQKNTAIIQWQLGYDANSISSPGKNELINWYFGNNIDLTLRWSKSAALIPRDVAKPCSGGQPVFDEDKRQVSFKYAGNWALFRLIANHITNLKDPDIASSSLANVLSFCVDQMSASEHQAAEPVRAFLRLSVLGVNPQTGLQETLRVPRQFPTAAPIIGKL